jgi:hypothetical protein
MRTFTTIRTLGVLAVGGAFLLAAGPAVAGPPGGAKPMSYTCSGGEIPSGDYARITVTGFCSVAEDAVITVVGNIDVAAGAMLDAQSAPSAIMVGRNVTGAEGSIVGLGCQPEVPGNTAHPCASDPENGTSDIAVGGNISLTGAMLAYLNGVAVGGNISIYGGGDSQTPWSIKNNDVAGNITVNGTSTGWIGVMWNHVGRNVSLSDMTVVDDHPGAWTAVFVVQNDVGWNLNCHNLVPGVAGGFTGIPNVVGHQATGQCVDVV